jgi:SAM-dependent methyltransferase
MTSQPQYVLGSDAAEVARLDGQAATIAAATGVLLRAAGIGGAMHVLELGTGLGHVAFQVAELLENGGGVLAVDQSADLLEVAERRRASLGLVNVRFVEGDARTFIAEDPVDAIVMRLLLFHLPDAVQVLRHQRDSLAPDGMVVAVDYDIGTSRAEPPVKLVDTALGWVRDAFLAAGADPVVGARLQMLLREAGFGDVTTFGVQRYLAPDDPGGPALLAGTVRSLAPQIVAAGIATKAQLGLDTLQARLESELVKAGAVIAPPCVVGAWARVKAAPP